MVMETGAVKIEGSGKIRAIAPTAKLCMCVKSTALLEVSTENSGSLVLLTLQ